MNRQNLGPEEAVKLDAIEALVTSLREEAGQAPENLSSRAADFLSNIIGSWKFITLMGTSIGVWIGFNAYLGAEAFDPYPFILLNLCLSFLSAFLLPVILMSGNRTDKKDRKHASRAYKTIGHIEELVKVLAELEGISSDPDLAEE